MQKLIQSRQGAIEATQMANGEPSKKDLQSFAKTEQIVKEIPWETLPTNIQEMLKANGKKFITRNSKCCCGSGRRFKRCCGKEIYKKS